MPTMLHPSTPRRRGSEVRLEFLNSNAEPENGFSKLMYNLSNNSHSIAPIEYALADLTFPSALTILQIGS